MPILPTWLTALTPVTETAAAGVGAGYRIAQSQLAREQIGQEASQFAQRQALERQQLQQQAALAALENVANQNQLQYNYAELSQRAAESFRDNIFNQMQAARDTEEINLKRDETRRKAAESAIRFQGVQDIQNDITLGLEPREAVLRNLGKISFGSAQIPGIPSILRPASSTKSSALKMIDELSLMKQNLDTAVSSGDTISADDLRSKIDLLGSQLEKSKQTFDVEFDDDGRVSKIRMGDEPEKKKSEITTATSSDLQKKNIQYGNAVQVLTKLQQELKPEQVGARGVFGEYIVDRALAQLDPSLANKDRIEMRTLLGAARESLLREISGDTRFSNVDRSEISQLLPSTGVFESYPNAIKRIEAVKNLLVSRGRNNAGFAGVQIPEYALTKEEWADRLKTEQITRDQLRSALERYFVWPK